MDMTREELAGHLEAIVEGERRTNLRFSERLFIRKAIAHLRQPAPTAPEGWELVPKLGTRVKAKHPITCLNPTEYFEVTGRRADPGTPSGFSVRGENTCWFGLSAIELPTPTAQGELPLALDRSIREFGRACAFSDTDERRSKGEALEQAIRAYGDQRARAAIATAQAAAGVPEGWQPIETAPAVKGDFFFCHLAWGPDEDKCTGDGFRWNGRWFAAGAAHMPGKERRYVMREFEVQPTHWMEKPAAPGSAPSAPALSLCAGDARDAARYRWLRDSSDNAPALMALLDGVPNIINGHNEFDQAIDDAMIAAPSHPVDPQHTQPDRDIACRCEGPCRLCDESEALLRKPQPAEPVAQEEQQSRSERWPAAVDILVRAGHSRDDAKRLIDGEPYSVVKAQAKQQPKCEDCKDTGQICVGTSGKAEDGNAPEFERCPSCSYGEPSRPKSETASREAFDASGFANQHPQFLKVWNAAWQAARRPVRELSDKDITDLWKKWVGTERPNYSFARALLARATGESRHAN